MNKNRIFPLGFLILILCISFVIADCNATNQPYLDVNTQLIALNILTHVHENPKTSIYQWPYYQEDDNLGIKSISIKNIGSCTSNESLLNYKLTKPDNSIISDAFCYNLKIPPLKPNETYTFNLKNITWNESDNVWYQKYYYIDSQNKVFSDTCQINQRLDIPGIWHITTELSNTSIYSWNFFYKGFLYGGEFKVRQEIELEMLKLTNQIGALTWILVGFTTLLIAISIIGISPQLKNLRIFKKKNRDLN